MERKPTVLVTSGSKRLRKAKEKRDSHPPFRTDAKVQVSKRKKISKRARIIRVIKSSTDSSKRSFTVAQLRKALPSIPADRFYTILNDHKQRGLIQHVIGGERGEWMVTDKFFGIKPEKLPPLESNSKQTLSSEPFADLERAIASIEEGLQILRKRREELGIFQRMAEELKKL